MKKYLIVIILLISAVKLYSQMSLEILELNLSQITSNQHDEDFTEGDEEGPYAYLKCSLYNQSNDNIYLSPSKAEIKFLYNYKGIDYEVDVVNVPFTGNDKLKIKRGEKIEFCLGTRLLLGTPLWEAKKEDYSLTLLGLLPTLRVQFQDANLNLFSSRIWKVNIK